MKETLKTTLGIDELNKRCDEVFDLQEDDYIYDVELKSDGQFIVNMSEVDEDGNTLIFDYIPDMSDRPEARDYLLGLRNDFND